MFKDNIIKLLKNNHFLVICQEYKRTNDNIQYSILRISFGDAMLNFYNNESVILVYNSEFENKITKKFEDHNDIRIRKLNLNIPKIRFIAESEQKIIDFLKNFFIQNMQFH
ncbi:hypothetical protein C2G38_2053807, partial [Gigaspora rosea]